MDGEGNELIMPKSEQIPKDRFRKGDTVRAIVHKVEMINGNPKLYFREHLQYSWKGYLRMKYRKYTMV